MKAKNRKHPIRQSIYKRIHNSLNFESTGENNHILELIRASQLQTLEYFESNQSMAKIGLQKQCLDTVRIWEQCN